jgi:hypothetical protein
MAACEDECVKEIKLNDLVKASIQNILETSMVVEKLGVLCIHN